MGNEKVGDRLTWESRAPSEGLEGLPSLVSVVGEKGLVDSGLQGCYVIWG